MRRLGQLLGVLVVTCAVAVLSQELSFHLDPNTDFSKYKSYKWVHSDHEANPVDPQIIVALDEELLKKGLKKTTSEDADVFFCYHSNFSSEPVHKYHTATGADPANPDTFLTVEKGRVALDMYDSSTKKVIWRNTSKINPETNPPQIAKAVSKLLKDYPPKKN